MINPSLESKNSRKLAIVHYRSIWNRFEDISRFPSTKAKNISDQFLVTEHPRDDSYLRQLGYDYKRLAEQADTL